MAVDVSYPGINTTIGAEFTLSRGAYASVGTLQMLPQENLDLPPGNLVFTGDTGNQFTIPCVLDMAFLRRRYTNERWRWSIQLYDMRKDWEGVTISGEYNKRISNGLIPNNMKKTAQELFTLLFTAVGAPATDVSEAPANVYPHVNWAAANVQDELTKLCYVTATDICPQANGTFKLCKLGVGATPPVNNFSRHPEFKFKPRNLPAVVEIVCGPDVFEAKFTLLAIGREVEGDHKLLPALDYAPDDWLEQHPYSFIDVSGDPSRAATFESVWRYFVAFRLAEGGTQPGGCEIPITKLYQLLPFSDWLISSFKDLDQIDRVGFAYVEGTWWHYTDWVENGDDFNTYPNHEFKLFNEWGMIRTEKATFKLDSNHQFSAPELYLTTAFNARTLDGELARLKLTRNMAGTGKVTIYRPEIFRAFRSRYNNANRIAVDSTANEASAEANAYLDLWETKFTDPWAWEGEYADIHEIDLNGKVAQLKIKASVNGYALTHFGVNEEFDVYNLSHKYRDVLNGTR